MLPQQLGRGKRLDGRHISGTCDNQVRRAILLVPGPWPDADADSAMCDRILHGEPLQRLLLARHNHVDVIPAAQTVVDYREQAVGVRRQVDTHHFRLLVRNVVQKAWVLVRKAVMILLPHMRGQKIVQ